MKINKISPVKIFTLAVLNSVINAPLVSAQPATGFPPPGQGGTLQPINSQNNSGTQPLDPVIEQRLERLRILEKEVELLEKQKEIRDAERDITSIERNVFDALLPNVDDRTSKPLEGKVEGLGTLQAESRFMVLQGMDKIAATISNRIPKNSTVIIYDTQLLDFLSEYQLQTLQLELLIGRYEAFFPENASSSR